MPFMSIDDPEFWKNCPKGLELISKSMEGTGGGVAYFVMGEPKDNAPTVVALRMAPNWVLPRHAHDCYRFEVVVQGTRREQQPRRYTALRFHFTIAGAGADENKARRAIDLSLEKYCSVVASLAPDIPVTYDVTLR